MENDYDNLWIISGKASAFRLRNSSTGNERDLHYALINYQLSDTLISLQRRSYQREGSKLFQSSKIKVIYDQAIDCLYQLYSLRKEENLVWLAFNFMEKSKNRVLFESLVETEFRNKVGVPDSISARERELKNLVTIKLKELEFEKNKTNPNTELLSKIQESLYQTERNQSHMRKQLAQSHPTYYQIKYDTFTIELTDIINALGDQNSGIINYFWGDGSLFATYISSKKTAFIKLSDLAFIKKQIRVYLNHLRSGPTLFHQNRDFQELKICASTLYEKLVGPLLGSSGQNVDLRSQLNWLIIVPDGPLSLIPFGALVTHVDSNTLNYKDLRYLIKEVQISYTYSANLFFNDIHKRKTTNNILAMSYTNPDESESNDLPDLPGSHRELDAIRTIVKDGIFLKGTKATKESFQSEAPTFNLLHLAVHGWADLENHFNSKLLFKNQYRSNDTLYAYELYDLRLNADIVVLSGCETVVGQQFKGEGIYSLARGFTYAGASTVIMTLWKVNDITTAEIVSEFYEQLFEQKSVAVAIRQAKLNYLDGANDLAAHPTYWASLIPLGKMSPLEFRDNTFLITIITITTITAVSLFLLIYLKRRRKAF